MCVDVPLRTTHSLTHLHHTTL